MATSPRKKRSAERKKSARSGPAELRLPLAPEAAGRRRTERRAGREQANRTHGIGAGHVA